MTVITGASKRNRTAGLRFTRAPLYQLSYAGIYDGYTFSRIRTGIYQVIIENSTFMQYKHLQTRQDFFWQLTRLIVAHLCQNLLFYPNEIRTTLFAH